MSPFPPSKCGSSEIIADASVIDHGHYNQQTDLTVATFRTPNAMLFKGKRSTKLSPWVCADCGFVELYADSPLGIKLENP